MMSSNYMNRREFIFTWKIQNYSSSYHKTGMELKSPTITAASLDDSKWYLSLYPRGYNKEHKDYISCFLHRAEKDKNDNLITLSFNIEIISPQRKVLNSWQRENFEFKWGQSHGCYNFMKISQFSSQFENWFEDNLMVRCHMNSETREKLFNECEIHTQINVARSSYKWSLKLEDSSDWTERKKFLLFDSSNLEIILTSPEDDFIITINKDINTFPYRHVTCKISLLDTKGTKRHSKVDAHYFDEANNSWNFPNFLTKTQLKAEEDTILNDGTFTLMFEFSTSNGIDPVVFEEYTSSTSLDSSNTENTFSALQNVLRKILTNEKYCDIKLRADNVTLPAHKSVLAARSPVFSAMFDQDMLENRNGFVDLTDLDGRSLKLFLDFLYTEELGHVDHETALNLLVNADKYQILSLKEICATQLMSTLSEQNVCEVIAVSDMIGYSVLKDYALDYVLTNPKSILSSTEWSEWIEHNTKLATEIFSKLAVQFGGATNRSLGKNAALKFDADPCQVKHKTVTGTGAFAAGFGTINTGYFGSRNILSSSTIIKQPCVLFGSNPNPTVSAFSFVTNPDSTKNSSQFGAESKLDNPTINMFGETDQKKY